MDHKYSGLLDLFGNDDAFRFLQAALDAMSAHVAILNDKGEIIAVNSAWVNYARDNDYPSRQSGLGENYCDVCRPAREEQDVDAITVSSAISRLLADPQPQAFEYDYLCCYPSDPTRDRWFHLTLNPFLQGKTRYILMCHEDITQIHLAERSRDLLEQAIAQTRSGVLITDATGTIVYANEAFAQICGYSIPEMLGKNPRFLKSGRIPHGTYDALWATISRGETWRNRVCNRRKDGRLYWEEQTISPMRDRAGVITHYVAVKEDVTEAHQRDLLHAGMIRAASDAFFVLDENARIIEWSPQAAALFGLTAHQAKGMNFPHQVLDGTLADEFEQELAAHMTTGKSRLTGRPMRLSMKNRDSEPFPAELSITAVNLDGVWRFASFVRDMTATLQTEQQLLQAQKMEAIGQLTGGMAHDFNNLLGIMSGSLDLLTSSVSDEGSALQKKYLGIAKDAARRAAEVTKSLMSVARRRPLNPVEINVNAAINDLAPLIHQTAGKRITADIFTSAELPLVRVEPTGFNNALINLVVNSRDAMPNGGRLLVYAYLYHAGHEFGGGGEKVLPSGDYVVIGVDDSGEGMSVETQAKAFEPFFTTKETGKGTGLGLAMVYGFCRQSGGTARITSKAGKGCSIQLLIPALAGTPPVAPGGQTPAVPAGTLGKPRVAHILVVDDDPDLLNIARHSLVVKGHEAVATTSPAKALGLLQNQQFDLLVTDVVMPGMDGVQLATRALEIAPDLSVMFVTGNAGMVPGALRERGVTILEKPVNLDVLSTAINNMLKGNQP